MFKEILLGLLAIIVLYLVTCFFGPSKMDVTTTKTLSGSPAQIYYQLIEYKNWPTWSKWIKADSTTKLTFGNPSSGLGGSYSWTSKESGAGSMKTTEVVENQLIKADLMFDDWNSTNKVVFELKPNGTKTDVTWSMTDEKPFPFVLRGMLLFTNMAGEIKNDFNTGLDNIEKLLVSGKAGYFVNGYLIQEGQFEGKNYLGKRSIVSFSAIGPSYGTHLPAIAQLAGNAITGFPCGIFWNYDEKTQRADMAPVMPVSLKEIKNDTYAIISVPSSKEFTLDYYGAYDKTQKAYMALDSLSQSKGYKFPQNVIEEFITDPMVEKDTTKWLTRIHFLVK
jgi:effector-binding domain-containing protein